MIQDIAPKKLDNQYKNKLPKNGDRVFCYHNNLIAIAGGKENLQFPEYLQVEAEGKRLQTEFHYHYLFAIDEQDFFLLVENVELFIEGFSYKKMYEVRSYLPKVQVMAASTAFHLYVWYRDNKFCGRCGAKLVHDEKQRMLKCDCGNLVFPKIAPAVIVGVVHKDRILMTKYANRDYKRYALIAGFTEIGETAEETVAREVMEETGVRVKNIRYYKCQPWGFDSNLLLGYFCELDGEEDITMDESELSVAEWVARENVETKQDDSANLSLTREMIMLFKDEGAFTAWKQS